MALPTPLKLDAMKMKKGGCLTNLDDFISIVPKHESMPHGADLSWHAVQKRDDAYSCLDKCMYGACDNEEEGIFEFAVVDCFVMANIYFKES